MQVRLSVKIDDNSLGGSTDFRYTCLYSGEALQGVVNTDADAAHETDWG